MINPYKRHDAKPPYRLEHLTYINTTFAGIPIQQTWTALYMLGKLIEEENIKMVVELGTGEGGLTKFFRNHCHTQTYDLPYDVFSEVIKREIQITISMSGKTLVFCDNGDKPRELIVYARYLKRGDHILVHDYRRPDGITYGDVELTMNEYKLVLYRQDEFNELGTYIVSLKKV